MSYQHQNQHCFTQSHLQTWPQATVPSLQAWELKTTTSNSHHELYHAYIHPPTDYTHMDTFTQSHHHHMAKYTLTVSYLSKESLNAIVFSYYNFDPGELVYVFVFCPGYSDCILPDCGLFPDFDLVLHFGFVCLLF